MSNRKHRTRPSQLFQSNDRVFQEFSPDHPARRYLLEFYSVRDEVCGRDIAWPGRPKVEQNWNSELLKRQFSFSAFAYTFISFELTMDEWFDPAIGKAPSNWERDCIELHSIKHALLDECYNAANVDQNTEILEFIARVRCLLDLGLAAIATRLGLTEDEVLKRWGKKPKDTVRRFMRSTEVGQ